MESTVTAALNSTFDFGIFLSNYGALFAIIVTILIAAAGLVYRLGKTDQKVDTAVKDMDAVKNDIKNISGDMGVVKSYLVNTSGMKAGLFASNSPVVLKPKGIKLLETSGFKQLFENHRSDFITKVKNLHPKNLADLDEVSLRVIETYRNDPLFENFKQVAFQNGTSIDTLFRVFSIYMRDEIARDIFPEKD